MLVADKSFLPLAVGVLTGAATLAGGVLVLRLRSAVGLWLAAAAGALIGVALFDLLPEALEMAGDDATRRGVLAAAGLGFALYLVLDRIGGLSGRSPARGVIGPASLTLHSLMDGFGIGVAFTASAAIGWIVAVAVLAHDLADGANTVTLSLEAGGSPARARAWLLADAAAPLVGILLARLTSLKPAGLAGLLGVFCGFFLYIGAAELLPRSHRERPRLSTVAVSLAAMAFMYVVARLTTI